MVEPLRRFARRSLFPFVTAAWATCLRGARPFLARGRAVRPWTPGGRVVVVAAHPDDETIGAGGVAALHVRAGDPVTIVVLTDGRGSRAGGLAPEEMAGRRHGELQRAAAALGVRDVVWLGFPEGEWEAAALQARLAPLLAGGDVIYAPSCVDFHPDHLRTARLVAGLVRPEQIVRIYELGVPLTPLLVNRVADIGAVAACKQHALECFVTQQGAMEPLGRLARYRAALYGHAASEVFWELPAPAYRRLVAAGSWEWDKTPFRGVRPRPLADGWAFFAGTRARWRLRALAEQDRG